MQKPIGCFRSKYQEQSAYRAPVCRKRGFEPSARSAIWRRRVPSNEKKDHLLTREEVITHASRPKGLASWLQMSPWLVLYCRSRMIMYLNSFPDLVLTGCCVLFANIGAEMKKWTEIAENKIKGVEDQMRHLEYPKNMHIEVLGCS